jgi:Putative mono-oxygenase ydhR
MKPLLSTITASLLASGTLAQSAIANPSFIATMPNAVVAIVVNKMQATVPQYEQLAGLHYKAFTLTQTDAQFGGIYLWKDRSFAQNWFNPAWHERVRKTYGNEAIIEWFDAPIAIASKLADNQLEGTKP